MSGRRVLGHIACARGQDGGGRWVLLMTKRGGGCYVDEKAGCALLMTKAAVWGLLRTGRWGVKFPGM